MKNVNPIKISFRDVKYVVNEEKRFVSCTMTAILRVPEDDNQEYYVGYNPKIFIVKGRAKCNPSDNFNETQGKIIARRRAENKAYKQISTKLRIYYKALKCQCKLIENFRRKSACVMAGFHNYIQTLKAPITSTDNLEPVLWKYLVTQGFVEYLFSYAEVEKMNHFQSKVEQIGTIRDIHMDNDIPGTLVLTCEEGSYYYDLLPGDIKQRIYDLIVNGC